MYMMNPCAILLYVIGLTLSTALQYATLAHNSQNCNAYYRGDAFAINKENNLGQMQVAAEMEIEFGLELGSCAPSLYQSIFQIGNGDHYDRHPALWIYNCNKWAFRWSTNNNRNNALNTAAPAITYPGSYTIYIKLTPTQTIFSVNGESRTLASSSRSNFFNQNWGIWFANDDRYNVPLNSQFSDICIRTGPGGQSAAPQNECNARNIPGQLPANEASMLVSVGSGEQLKIEFDMDLRQLPEYWVQVLIFGDSESDLWLSSDGTWAVGEWIPDIDAASVQNGEYQIEIRISAGELTLNVNGQSQTQQQQRNNFGDIVFYPAEGYPLYDVCVTKSGAN